MVTTEDLSSGVRLGQWRETETSRMPPMESLLKGAFWQDAKHAEVRRSFQVRKAKPVSQIDLDGAVAVVTVPRGGEQASREIVLYQAARPVPAEATRVKVALAVLEVNRGTHAVLRSVRSGVRFFLTLSLSST